MEAAPIESASLPASHNAAAFLDLFVVTIVHLDGCYVIL
jgi:hypothetical protein